MRCTITQVLPLPAPARISRFARGEDTASRWASFKLLSRSETSIELASRRSKKSVSVLALARNFRHVRRAALAKRTAHRRRCQLMAGPGITRLDRLRPYWTRFAVNATAGRNARPGAATRDDCPVLRGDPDAAPGFDPHPPRWTDGARLPNWYGPPKPRAWR